MAKHVVKRHGKTQEYDEKKVYASVYAACLNAHYTQEHAEEVALLAMRKISVWINDKVLVNAHQIGEQIMHELHDDEVALMYKHHLDIC